MASYEDAQFGDLGMINLAATFFLHFDFFLVHVSASPPFLHSSMRYSQAVMFDL